MDRPKVATHPATQKPSYSSTQLPGYQATRLPSHPATMSVVEGPYKDVENPDVDWPYKGHRTWSCSMPRNTTPKPPREVVKKEEVNKDKPLSRKEK